jgi:excisionase family DNA binding protein
MTFCITAEEAARALGVKLKHIYYLVYMGELEGWKIRGAWRLFRISVEEYDKARNHARIDQSVAGDNVHQGCRGVSTLFGINDPKDDLGTPTHGLHGRRRVEYCQARLPRVSLETLEPLNRRQRGRSPISHDQIEFNFAEAV